MSQLLTPEDEARRAGKIVKALSLTQPWAWVVVYLNKDIENRKRRIFYKEPFYIHATKVMTYEYYIEVIYLCKQWSAPIELIPSFEEMLTMCGGIVGQTRITDILPKTGQVARTWHMRDQWGHVLVDTKAVDFFPCKGNQGLWEAEHIYDAIAARKEATCPSATAPQQILRP